MIPRNRFREIALGKIVPGRVLSYHTGDTILLHGNPWGSSSSRGQVSSQSRVVGDIWSFSQRRVCLIGIMPCTFFDATSPRGIHGLAPIKGDLR